VDPERDTTETMREYVAHFDADIKGVSGDIEQLKILTSALGIFFEKSTDSGENYNVAHSAVVLLINPQAEFHAWFSAPHDVEHFVNDVPLLTGST
jgi:protein SCO1/2